MFPTAANATTGQFAYEPCAGGRARAGRRRARRRRASLRAGSPRATQRSPCSRSARSRHMARAGAARSDSSRSNDWPSSRCRCSSRDLTSPVARARGDRNEVVVREPRASGSRVDRQTSGTRCRTSRTEPSRFLRAHDADVDEAVVERAVEDELAPARCCLGAQGSSSSSRADRDRSAVECDLAPADPDGPEEEADGRVTRALSRRARSVSPAKRCAPAARPVPAHTAEMSLRWFQTRSSSSRIVRARASSARAEARALPRPPVRTRRRS